MTDRSPSLTECSLQELRDEIQRRIELHKREKESKSKHTPAEYTSAINENRRRDMLNMRRAGLTFSKIGKHFGIHGYTVSTLVRKQERIEKYDKRASDPACLNCGNTNYNTPQSYAPTGMILLSCDNCTATRYVPLVYFKKFPTQSIKG